MVNLVGKVPPLEASGAAVTLVHPTATTVVGQWDVTYPQDMPEEQRPTLGPTRTFGYAHRLVEKPPRFARRHVRRDVQIDARDKNGWSNAESQIDSAARELSGDVVFQRTLTGDDLGALVPNVDFKQGDVLPLMVWGMIVPATCTSIRYALEDGVRTVEVGFGPSLMADRDGLAENMQQIDRQMRAEAAGIDEYLAQQLDEAKAASKEQVDGLKTYVDEQDKGVQAHATSAASSALTAAKADATTKANTAETRAKNYAKTQDEELLKSAKSYADDAAKQELDKARQAIDDYRKQVTVKIGEQGTITKELAALNQKFKDELGPTGSVVQENKKNARLLSAIINGTNIPELSNSQFKEHQQLVNDMQAVFNEQVAGTQQAFRELFVAQAVINEMNDAFKGKQMEINEGFEFLFGVNDKLNLAQDYLIEYNKIMTESRQAHISMATYYGSGDITNRRTVGVYMPIEKGGDEGILGISSVRLYNNDLSVSNKYPFFEAHKITSIASYNILVQVPGGARSTMDSGVFGISGSANVNLDLDNYLIKGEKNWSVELYVTAFPTTLLPQYKQRLDALDAEYRKKGLRL